MLRCTRAARGVATSAMSSTAPRNPLVAVVGATGTGKSELAVSLAHHYNGEIINGDAMQLYAGLPIVTNKLPLEEQRGVRHHLLGCVGFEEETWVVGTFVRRALDTIAEIRARGRLPILVGGTHYYTQSLLFADRLADSADAEAREGASFVPDPEERWPILQQSTESLLAELQKVDPVMAERWHPNDRRKILTSLAIYLRTGKRASDIYAEQRQRGIVGSAADGADGAHEALKLRFPTLLFWVHTAPTTLEDRLDKRVNRMLDQGLLQEVETLVTEADRQAASSGHPVDETRGIWVSIGYKEFKDYHRASRETDTDPAQLERLRSEAIERTKTATRRYSKRQIRWIRLKLVNALAEANSTGNLFLLDSSHADDFHSDVESPAAEVTEAFLRGLPLPQPASLSATAADMLAPNSENDPVPTPQKWAKNHCDVCGVTCVTENQWTIHLRGRAHRRLSRKAVLDPGRYTDSLET